MYVCISETQIYRAHLKFIQFHYRILTSAYYQCFYPIKYISIDADIRV